MSNRIKLSRDWRFKKFADGKCDGEVFLPPFDDADWENVRVPHDWAANGVFDMYNDFSCSEVAPDGITHPIEHTGRTGALPIVGLGVYRRFVEIPQSAKGKRITLEFDGIMWESSIYVNGEKVFFNHWGYKSFEVDITDHVSYGEPNLIAVAAEVFTDCSRWYPGAGIYRNVYLVEKEETHINYDGVWVRQLELAADHVSFELSVEHSGDDSVKFKADIYSPNGEVVATLAHGVSDFGELSDIFVLKDPMIWDVEHPYLYRAEVSLLDKNSEAVDFASVKFGVRTFEFTVEHGFYLNGRQLKMKGVCLHHDLGSLGAAFNVAAARRQLKIMAEMGANAIRTSHNPPAKELLDLCDEMGFLVIDEFFDEWIAKKTANGYSQYFLKNAASDAESVIKRDRNHPSIIMWSIGNEIYEQMRSEGWRASKLLTEVCHRTDPTRPVTAGINMSDHAIKNHVTDYLDVIGFNYHANRYQKIHREHPNAKLYGSETASCISTRGVYDLPAKIVIPCEKRADLSVSAYDMEAPAWAYYAEREFASQDDCEFLAGEFVWTGFDYLGEPTPYYEEWPSRSSYFGIVDMCGLPKNRYYGYMAQWSEKEVLHVFPHWNWDGHEGEIVPVHAYSSYKEAELFINGKSFGRQTLGDKSGGALGEIERYRFMWNNAVYEAGEIKVVAYDENGNAAAEQTVKTAGVPHHIVLSADRAEIAPDGDDLVYVTAAAVDEQGNICPHFGERLYFSVENAELLTTDNGDPRETESFARHDKKCLAGYCVACVRSIEGKDGALTLSVRSDVTPEAAIEIKYKH